MRNFELYLLVMKGGCYGWIFVWPIGLMFTLIGVILVVYGAVTGKDPEMYKRSLGYEY